MSKRKTKETKVKAAPAKKAKRVKPAPGFDERNGPDDSTTAEAASAAPVVTAAAKPEREVRNGVKRPKDGGKCAEVWEALDQLHAAGVVPTSKDVRDLATAKPGWNENNAMAELSAWRKFMGLSKPHNMKRKRKTVAKEVAPAVVTEAAVS
jgi:hypothetical protein